ncbi:hypothetical protein SBD_2260 [Streptomyces bottropensis ATCC 25435]|uniref:Uncharacterized protein n=1 Tax=Streptomyces bottropensis ATCC 25435 TaxID=1054862 RepID=M3EJ31_9ACTN|nr:hypothetical protein SBD_2260 [Streptomyces bottropensis ATCC 25435]
MIRGRREPEGEDPCALRASGGDPLKRLMTVGPAMCSPRERR